LAKPEEDDPHRVNAENTV